MLDFIDIQEQLLNWIETFVERPHPKLGNWSPCPYASKARISNKINILIGDTPETDVDMLLDNADWEKWEIYIFCYPNKQYEADEFLHKLKQLNIRTMPLDVVLFQDHPDKEEFINGVNMNFGPCTLLLAQQLSELNKAADSLKKSNYYHLWSEQDLDDIVNWRYSDEKKI